MITSMLRDITEPYNVVEAFVYDAAIARALLERLPLTEREARRIEGTPALRMRGRKEG